MKHMSELILLPLQKRQSIHDDLAHRDILNLSHIDKLKHMTLHFFKYAGRIASARERQDTEVLKRCLIDAFIICLSTANALNMSLGKLITTSKHVSSLLELSATLSEEIDKNDLFMSSVFGISETGGRFAKVLESLDHLELGNHRQQLEHLLPILSVIVLAHLGCVSSDLESAILSRYEEVEAKLIF